MEVSDEISGSVRAALDYAAAAGDGDLEVRLVDAKTDQATALAALSSATGIWLTAPDQARVMAALATCPAITSAVHDRWASGASGLLLDNAAAAAVGPSMTADPTTPSDTSGLEEASSVEFLVTICHLAASASARIPMSS